MRSSIHVATIALSFWLATCWGEVRAQTDAENSLNNAREAFAAEQFAAARDLLTTAAQTDADNPDIYLLLGRAHYQLGEIDQAIKAWKRTLELAPAQAYAKQMVDTLEGKIVDTDVRLDVAESLLRERMAQAASQSLYALRRSGLTAAQRTRWLSLHAESLVEIGDVKTALPLLRELSIRSPEIAATAKIRRLTGVAKLRAGGEFIAEGVQMLEAVAREFADTDEGASAQLALISFRISQDEQPVDSLKDWIAAHPEHAKIAEARQMMISAVYVYLEAAKRLPKPDQDATLSELDEKLLSAAEQAFALVNDVPESQKLAGLIVSHFNTRFVQTKAYTPADTALKRMLSLELLPASKQTFETALVASQEAAASDQLDQILVATREGDASPDTLKQWIQAHAKHPRLSQARRQFVTTLLRQTQRQGRPDAQAALAESDEAAIDTAAIILESLDDSGEKLKLIDELLAHVQTHYAAHRAYEAAISAQRAILGLPLPRSLRRRVYDQLADTQTAVAMSQLEREVVAGTLKAGPLPNPLDSLLETFAAINADYPEQPSWSKQATAGTKIAALGERVAWPEKVTDIKATDRWALAFVLPVIVADYDVKVTQTANAVVESIVNGVAQVTQKSARGLARKTHQRLLDRLPQDHSLWAAAMTRQLSLRVSDDAVVFQENASSGRSESNRTLSDDQKEILKLASQLNAVRPNQSAQVLTLLEPMLALRRDAGYVDAVQEAYGLLEQSLPPTQRGTIRLAVAKSWIDQVIAKHNRLLSNGFQPPKDLDPQITKALARCYELASALQPGDPMVSKIQGVRTVAITHYRNLQNFEAAEAAIAVKAEQDADWLDALADFEVAGLRMSRALDELAKQTEQFQGRDNITLIPSVKEAIAGFQKFITDRPGDPLIASVVTKIFNVGKTFEQYEKYDIAAAVYADLETFALANESLQDAKPNVATVAEQAALAVAMARHTKATKELAETLAGQPKGADPPAQLSDSFQSAIAAYTAITTKYVDGPLVSSAIGKVMEIALQHANVGAWDVADQVYADLAALQLPLRQPERLELARALCEVGKVMPAHAQQVLAAISLWQRQALSAAEAGGQIAQFRSAPNVVGDFSFGGGISGGGGFGGGMAGPGGVPGNELESRNEPVPEAGAAMAMGAVGTVPPDPFAANMEEMDMLSEAFTDEARASRESNLLAAVRRRQSAQATQIAMLRDNQIQQVDRVPKNDADQKVAQQQTQAAAVPVLSEAEIKRRQTVLEVAYTKLQAIRKAFSDTSTADQAREEIMMIANHWRSIRQWQRAASLVKQFLTDNPTDIHLPQLRYEVAQDYLAWAAGVVKPDVPKQELLEEVNQRFTMAREELSGIIAAFPDNQDLKHRAQWAIASSHLSQARVVAGFSSTLARGQFVRAANELLTTADLYHDHPKVNELPQMLSSIAQELTSRRFYDEAITVWNEMTLHYPGHPLAEQAALLIAQTYQNQLRLPLRAVEAYLELNFARGGTDVALQNSIFQIASQLMGEKRWVESLHVLETFIDSFPHHASAGQALTMIGQVHQTNEVWEDAIAAYRRVILEYDQGDWARQSKWSIAQCTINLSRWEEAQGAYREYQKAYPEDPKIAEATARLEILKDLARFQKVVDEKGQRKAFDAQYQIGSIVRSKLSNPIKAIIEYRKVAAGWPESHLADDALFQVGMIYMELGRTEDARDAFLATAEKYPTSPLADDALFQVGASFENEAQMLVGVTRGKAVEIANDIAQRQAYTASQDNRRFRRAQNLDLIAQLKKEGKQAEVDSKQAFQAAQNVAFDQANAAVFANWASQQEEALTTAQLADRQDKINAALRKAVASFRRAASVASADKADDSLLRMAQIYDQRLKDSDAAMATWLEIVKQYSGTTVAEDASWKIAQYYQTHEKYADAIAAYNSFLRNYRRSPKASEAQAAIAENHEQLGNWVEAMDAYTNYINNYPEGTLTSKAREQIAWIKTYRL